MDNPQSIRSANYASSHLPADVRIAIEMFNAAICPKCGFVEGIYEQNVAKCAICGSECTNFKVVTRDK